MFFRVLHRLRKDVCFIPARGPIVHELFLSTVPGLNFDMCMISTRIKTPSPLRNYLTCGTKSQVILPSSYNNSLIGLVQIKLQVELSFCQLSDLYNRLFL